MSNTTKNIQLTQGQVALVADEAHDWLSRWRWYALWHPNTRSFRAVRSVTTGLSHPRQRLVHMHRAVWEYYNGPIPDGSTVDHADRDSLNNCLSNLRLATDSQQGQNRRLRSDNTSGYRGVSWNKQFSKWRARITVDGKVILLGDFTDPLEAALARDAAARIYHGEFAVLNFPERELLGVA